MTVNQLKIDMSVCEYSLLTRINLTKCCNQDKIIRKFVTRIVIRIRIMRFDQDLMKSKCRKLGGGALYCYQNTVSDYLEC